MNLTSNITWNPKRADLDDTQNEFIEIKNESPPQYVPLGLDAVNALYQRTADRESCGVEGTHED